MLHTAEPQMRYYLSHHVFVCVSGRHLVMLDLARGRYSGLPLAHASQLGAWIEGWPLDTDEPRASVPPKLLMQLLRADLVTSDPELGKAARPVIVTRANNSPVDAWVEDSRPTRLVDLWHFLTSVAYATCALRWQPLSAITRRIEKRKAQRSGTTTEMTRIVQLMRIYGRLRPWLYARKDMCMLHSLAVLEFLAHYEVFPDWVLGIRAVPFQAHSWLQYGGQPLTDSPLHVDRLTPILVI